MFDKARWLYTRALNISVYELTKMSTYSKDWIEIAFRFKTKAGWRCTQCGHQDEHSAGYGLTVHHINRDKSDNSEENLAALCQRCHLRFERVAMGTAQGQLKLFQGTKCER